MENSSSLADLADPVEPFERAVQTLALLKGQNAPGHELRAARERADAEHKRLMAFLNKEQQTMQAVEKALTAIRSLQARLWALSQNDRGGPSQTRRDQRKQGRPQKQGPQHGRPDHRRGPPPVVEIVYRRRVGTPTD